LLVKSGKDRRTKTNQQKKTVGSSLFFFFLNSDRLELVNQGDSRMDAEYESAMKRVEPIAKLIEVEPTQKLSRCRIRSSPTAELIETKPTQSPSQLRIRSSLPPKTKQC
jgi:hypothetical protein